MNLNRMRNSLKNRDWSSKSKQTNVNYLKTKLKQFGLSIPKYLKEGNLTERNINALTNKLLKSIDNEKEKQRIYVPESSREREIQKLQKTIDKHNRTLLKKISYATQKYNLSEKYLNYLMGYKVDFDYETNVNKYGHSFKRDFSQFQLIEKIPNFNKIETIKEYEKMVRSLTARLTNANLEKELGTGGNIKRTLNAKFKEWENDNLMDSKTKKRFIHKISKLNAIQKEILYKMMTTTGMFAVKYSRKEGEEGEELEYNIYKKIGRLIDKASEF